MRYWLGIVSKEHVQKGVQGGFAQVCHGKKAPLAKMAAGDGFIYYSPKMALNRPEHCKCFTAIGKIKNGKIYQIEMTPTFVRLGSQSELSDHSSKTHHRELFEISHPFRIDIEYFPCDEVPIAAVFDKLALTQRKSWGMQLRRGLLEISNTDFFTIAKAMRSDCENCFSWPSPSVKK